MHTCVLVACYCSMSCFKYVVHFIYHVFFMCGHMYVHMLTIMKKQFCTIKQHVHVILHVYNKLIIV